MSIDLIPMHAIRHRHACYRYHLQGRIHVLSRLYCPFWRQIGLGLLAYELNYHKAWLTLLHERIASVTVMEEGQPDSVGIKSISSVQSLKQNTTYSNEIKEKYSFIVQPVTKRLVLWRDLWGYLWKNLWWTQLQLGIYIQGHRYHEASLESAINAEDCTKVTVRTHGVI